MTFLIRHLTTSQADSKLMAFEPSCPYLGLNTGLSNYTQLAVYLFLTRQRLVAIYGILLWNHHYRIKFVPFQGVETVGCIAAMFIGQSSLWATLLCRVHMPRSAQVSCMLINVAICVYLC